jgi:hypothetical protein
MINSIKIIAEGRIACKDDVFDKNLLIAGKTYLALDKENMKITGTIIAPEIHNVIDAFDKSKERYFFDEFLMYSCSGVLLILTTENESSPYSFELRLDEAFAEDFKTNTGKLQYNFTYYIKDSDCMLGPCVVTNDTDVYEIKRLLDEKKIYKISSVQNEALNHNNLHISK